MADERLIAPGILDESNRALNGLAERISDLDRSAVNVYDIDNVTETALDHLLEQFSVDFVTPNLTAAQKRELIKASIPWHRLKGTPGALQDIVKTLLGVEPEVREKPLWIVGWSKIGVDPVYNPPNQFRPDVVLNSYAAAEAGLSRADAEQITKKMKRGTAHATVRMYPFLVGSQDYGLVGVDLIQRR